MKPLLFCHTYHTREHKYYIVKLFINQGHNSIVKKKSKQIRETMSMENFIQCQVYSVEIGLAN